MFQKYYHFSVILCVERFSYGPSGTKLIEFNEIDCNGLSYSAIMCYEPGSWVRDFLAVGLSDKIEWQTRDVN